MNSSDKSKRKSRLTLRPGAAVYGALFLYALLMTQLLKNPASAVFFWFIVIILPVSFAAVLINAACIQVYVFCEKPVAQKLEDIAYEVRIINSSPLPIPFASAVTTLPQAGGVRCAKQRLALSLPPFGGYSVKTDVSFRYRGLYEIGVESVDVSDPFRIFRIRKNIHNYSSVRIYPRTLPLDTYEERAASDTPAPFTRAAATPDAAEAANIREYRMGDQLRSVHWKLSAKADDLMVRDFNTNDDRRTCLIIDLAAPTPRPQTADEKQRSRFPFGIFKRRRTDDGAEESGSAYTAPDPVGGAVSGAADKADISVDTTTGKINDPRSRLPFVKAFAELKSRRAESRYRRRIARGESEENIEAAEMIDKLILETSKRRKNRGGGKNSTSASRGERSADGAGTASKNSGSAQSPVGAASADNAPTDGSISELIDSIAAGTSANGEKKPADDPWGGTPLAEYADEMPEYCADAVVEIGASLLAKELKGGNRCIVLWYASENGEVTAQYAEASSFADFEYVMSRFSCAPPVGCENRAVGLADAVPDTREITFKIVSANLDPRSIGEYCSLPSRFGGAGAGCSTELYAVDPERRYTSPAARLRYADSCRIQLRGSGVVMKDITESAGYDGSTRLTDRFS